jgi:hypothetical protein
MIELGLAVAFIVLFTSLFLYSPKAKVHYVTSRQVVEAVARHEGRNVGNSGGRGLYEAPVYVHTANTRANLAAELDADLAAFHGPQTTGVVQ